MEKMENLLSLALETPLEERKKTLDLNVGYEEGNDTWEVIVKYNGSLYQLENGLMEQLDYRYHAR